ncbi:MAG: thioredoxin family protein [Candidatus Omnitrophota bacterium]|nr:thioredoxin family protein [Candidatus Omnitrophota bacterium]
MKNIWILSAIIFLTAGFAQQPQGVVTGETAPDFSLVDINGVRHSLSDSRGKFVVLEWVNHDCPFVRKHYDSGNMQQLQQTYTGKGVVWLSIGSSAPGGQGHFPPEKWVELTSEKRAAPTAVLLDADGKTGKRYGAQTTPHMYIINPEGTLIYQGAIDSIASADKADIAEATNYVQTSLDLAMAGRPVPVGATKSYGCSVKYKH